MAKKKSIKKLTPNQQEYNRQVLRIKKLMRRAEKRGFWWEQPPIPENRPKVVTKQMLEKLAYLNPDRLYAKAKYVDTSTGEILSGTRGRDLERKAAARKGYATQIANRRSAENLFAQGLEQEEMPTRRKETPVKPPEMIKARKPADGGLTIYMNVVEGYLKRLQQPAASFYPQYKGRAARRAMSAVEASDNARTLLLGYIERLTTKHEKSKVGWIFNRVADQIGPLLDVVMYDSRASAITAAASEIIQILSQSAVDMGYEGAGADVLQAAEDINELNEVWEEPE